MKSKKTMAMLLGAAMTLSAFTACAKVPGGNPGGNPDDGDNPKPQIGRAHV